MRDKFFYLAFIGLCHWMIWQPVIATNYWWFRAIKFTYCQIVVLFEFALRFEDMHCCHIVVYWLQLFFYLWKCWLKNIQQFKSPCTLNVKKIWCHIIFFSDNIVYTHASYFIIILLFLKPNDSTLQSELIHSAV